MGDDISEEEFNTAVLVYAHYLGINLEEERELISIAEEALKTLPEGWELGVGDGDAAGIPYFYEIETEDSVWKHPNESIYIKKVKEAKIRLKEKKKARSQSPVKDRDRESKSVQMEVNAKTSQQNPKKTQQQQQKQQDQQRRRQDDDDDDDDQNDAVEVMEFSDFGDDNVEEKPKSAVSKSSSAPAASVHKKSDDGPGFGMRASDFFEDDGDERSEPTPQRPSSANNRDRDNDKPKSKDSGSARWGGDDDDRGKEKGANGTKGANDLQIVDDDDDDGLPFGKPSSASAGSGPGTRGERRSMWDKDPSGPNSATGSRSPGKAA